ncbi:MAG: hypothetical protein ACM3UT_08495 [Chloroflexota bacterium]
MRNKAPLILSMILFSVSLMVSGQKQVNSPYSRFNIGTMEPAGAFRSQGMGGVSVGMRDNTSIFFSNPASYSAFDTTSFVFDFGIDYSLNKLSFGKESHKSDDMNFDHLIVGFPISKGFGMAAGIVPVSNGYYKLKDQVTSADAGYNPVIGSYTSSHTGDGGFTEFFVGTGLNLHKYVSAGVNVNILFGQIKRTNKFVFEDAENVYNDNANERLQVSGINLDYGVQLMLPIKENKFLNAGLSFTAGRSYKTDYENFIFRYTTFGTADTVSFTSGEGNPLKLPGTVRAGVAFGKTNALTIGLDFISTRWSDAVIPGSEGYAADTKTFMFGVEYTPEKYSNISYLKRLDYRLGGHFGDNYLIINGEQLKEMGVSAGIGIPMRRGTLSKANLFIDYSRRYGSEAAGLHMEHYLTAGASINLYDVWFWKRRYN